MTQQGHTAGPSVVVPQGPFPIDLADLPASVVTTSTPTVEFLASGATQYVFQASKYGIKADAVVDVNGQLISGTDDTAAWLALIASLPADKAVIRLHGMSLVSNSGAFGSSVALLFNTHDLSLIGDGPHTGFVLAHNANCNVLRFNSTGTNTGPPRNQRIYLENFTVDHQGYYQADPGAGVVGAIVAYACSSFTAKSIRVLNAKSTSMSIVACRQVDIADPYLDTVVPGGAANGINCIGTQTATSGYFRVHDGHFIDVPDKAVDAGGIGGTDVTISGNTVEIRNVRPVPAGLTGNPFIGFQPGGTTAPAWASGTNYAVGSFVSNGGFNYVALVASGPGNGGAVTPGTNNAIWWLQNVPLAWSAATSYVVGQCVYYTAPTGVTGQVEGGTTLNLTCISASTNNPPINGSGNVDAHWQIGGPLAAAGRSAGTIGAETTPTPATRNISVTGNALRGQNLGGEYVIGYGIQVSSSKAFAGISARDGVVSGNSLRGIANAAIIANDENFAVVGNSMEDCTIGIQVGYGLSFTQRQWLIANNAIKLGGLGGGSGIFVNKAVSTYALSNGLVKGNVIDGGMGPSMDLAAALVATNVYTTISVSHCPAVLPIGTPLVIGKMPQGGGQLQVATLSQATAIGDTTLNINSFTVGASTFNIGTPIAIVPTTLSAQISNGVATGTSLAVTATAFALQRGTTLIIPDATGASPQQAVLTADAPVGSTTLTITSFTPSSTCAIGQPCGVWGLTGISVNGQVTQSQVSGNTVGNVALNGYVYSVSTGTPSTIDQVNCWAFNCGAYTNVGSTLSGIRLLGGGWLGCTSAGSFTGSGANYVLRRGVQNINPGGVVAGPAVPATGVNATNQTGFDCTVYVFGGTVTDLKVGGTTLGGPTSGPVRVVAGQTIQWVGSVAPTWVWVAD